MVVDALHGVRNTHLSEVEPCVYGLHVGQDRGGVCADLLHACRDASADSGRVHFNTHHIGRSHLGIHIDAHHVHGGNHVENLNIVLVLTRSYVEGADFVQVVLNNAFASLDSSFERGHLTLE